MSIVSHGLELGVVFGFAAAFLQSLSYLCSRLFMARHNNDIVKLLAISHILMGIMSIPLAFFLLPETMPAVSVYLSSLLIMSIFYLLGQFFLFSAIIKFEPSLVSPLLGVKILILAIISSFLHQNLNLWKWLAVILSLVSVFLISYSGKRIQWKCIVLVLLASVCYCLSDLGGKSTVDKFSFLGLLHRSSLSVAFCYILCGIFGLITLLLTPRNTSKDTWIYSVPFAVSWFAAMIFLFACFALIGVVFGNVIQSTRGIISILLAVLVSYIGYAALEPKITRVIFIRRIIAAILMTCSVALFWCDPL